MRLSRTPNFQGNELGSLVKVYHGHYTQRPTTDFDHLSNLGAHLVITNVSNSANILRHRTMSQIGTNILFRLYIVGEVAMC